MSIRLPANIVLVFAMTAGLCFAQTTAPTKLPKPQFQGDYFGEMARSFCAIREVDAKGHSLLVLKQANVSRNIAA